MASRLTTYIVVLIVAGTLIAGLIVGAQRDDLSGPVEIIVTNGRVHTPEGLAEALAIRGNKILRVGSNREIKRLRRPQTIAIDAHGGAVLPGFNDAHAHTLSGARGLAGLDLSTADTLPAIQERIRGYATAHPDREWLRGSGWTYEAFGGELPTREMLDAVVPDRPAWFTSDDGQTGWANSRALAAAGITRTTQSPRNGTIVRDRRGDPGGALKGEAMTLVGSALSASDADELAALRDATAFAHRVGVTSVQNAGGSPEDLALFDALRQESELDLRVYQAFSVGPGFSEADADRLDEIRAEYPDDPLLKAGAVTLTLDGAPDTETAALLAPPADRPASGTPTFTAEELTRIVTLLDRRGWQVMIQAPDDGTVRMALDAFEHAARVNPPPAQGRRHRIEHIDTIDPADVARFAELGVIASFQPNDGPAGRETWRATLDPERAAEGWACESLRRAGATVALGSDWPVMSLDPRYGLHVVTTGAAADGAPEEGWVPDARMSLSDAIAAYSAGGAFASFDDERKGTLEAGMLADVVVLSGDIFAPDVSILDADVTVTIFDGRVVYSREEMERIETE